MNRDQYLARQRRRPESSGTAVPAAAPITIDSDEQEKLIAEITREVEHQTTFFTRVFSGWLLACGVVLVLCSLKLLLAGRNGEPWPHRAVLENVPDAAFHVTYLGQLLGLYLAHRVARGSGWHILPGVMLSWTSLFSWLAVFRHFGVTNPLFYWLPLGPAVALAAAVYLFTSQKRLEREVKELEGSRYNLKGA
ncbi:unnamed protein product [Ectocarpus sp. CCAP 1310/34]|nr:unnamed protein product [Ectocarpus sp. CCAP 1310/34]